ncbi:hypothetical protein HGM15179_017770 [Zosterops borbonicus]|uniref:VWFC domain-containing protein n=1 Tax=Zosterops borbonicus TaxID=364589 RepID=A0A8K1G095_9PASS|nr:hypothetical protein HGM15179_017770 [Zosterops borbonicus]
MARHRAAPGAAPRPGLLLLPILILTLCLAAAAQDRDLPEAGSCLQDGHRYSDKDVWKPEPCQICVCDTGTVLCDEIICEDVRDCPNSEIPFGEDKKVNPVTSKMAPQAPGAGMENQEPQEILDPPDPLDPLDPPAWEGAPWDPVAPLAPLVPLVPKDSKATPASPVNQELLVRWVLGDLRDLLANPVTTEDGRAPRRDPPEREDPRVPRAPAENPGPPARPASPALQDSPAPAAHPDPREPPARWAPRDRRPDCPEPGVSRDALGMLDPKAKSAPQVPLARTDALDPPARRGLGASLALWASLVPKVPMDFLARTERPELPDPRDLPGCQGHQVPPARAANPEIRAFLEKPEPLGSWVPGETSERRDLRERQERTELEESVESPEPPALPDLLDPQALMASLEPRASRESLARRVMPEPPGLRVPLGLLDHRVLLVSPVPKEPGELRDPREPPDSPEPPDASDPLAPMVTPAPPGPPALRARTAPKAPEATRDPRAGRETLVCRALLVPPERRASPARTALRVQTVPLVPRGWQDSVVLWGCQGSVVSVDSRGCLGLRESLENREHLDLLVTGDPPGLWDPLG